MRDEPTILHLDLDAFFAAVEQRDKPSLRGKPVIVGGIGPRGVVSTASYEARAFGIGSAMRTTEARSRCPHAAYLSGRFGVYRQASRAVLGVLRELSDAIEPLSLDEAYVDLVAGSGGGSVSEPPGGWTVATVESTARRLKDRVREASGGLTASVGAGSSKLIAKIASDLDKPDGLVVVPPGTELAFLHPMPVTRVPGVGPATATRLHRIGVRSIGELAALGESELITLVGRAHGSALARLARGEDPRKVESSRANKSISVEDTFERDISDPAHLAMLTTRLAGRVAERLTRSHLSGRTITVKIRLFDFSTHTRSATLPGPTDDQHVIVRMARRLLGEVDTSAGVRLLGVGVSGLADWVQDDLFSAGRNGRDGPDDQAEPSTDEPSVASVRSGPVDAHATSDPVPYRYVPGQDVIHVEHGAGWVWGAGLGRVTVRFETAATGPGPVRTFADDDRDLAPYTPLFGRAPLPDPPSPDTGSQLR